jgi:hypothetical protein
MYEQEERRTGVPVFGTMAPFVAQSSTRPSCAELAMPAGAAGGRCVGTGLGDRAQTEGALVHSGEYAEALGQHVLDKAVEEGNSAKRGDFPVLGAESDATLVEGAEILVGDAYSVGIATPDSV